MSRLSLAKRAELEQLAIPVEGGTPLEACVVLDGGAARLAWMRDGGRRKEPFGPIYTDALLACEAAGLLNERAYGPARW